MKVICLVAGIIFSCSLYAQNSPSLYNEVVDFPDKLFGVIEKRTNDYEKKLVDQTGSYLRKLARREKKLQRKLWKKDSTAAKQLFGNPDSTYQQLQQQLKSGKASTFRDLAYNGHLDSMQTALRFIDQQGLPGKTAAIQSSLNNYTQLQQKLNGTEAIQKQLQQRQQYLQQQLQSIGLVKELDAFKKDVYYYKQQLNTYKEAFNDPEKLESVLMQTVNKIPAFQKFFNSNSQLASLFRMSDATAGLGGLAGLQSRSQLQQDLQQRLGAGPNGQALQQQVSPGSTQLNQLRAAINKKGGSDADMPDFKPNTQKTKSLLQRLEYGSNVQSVKSNTYFPTTTDIGLSLGYKINDKSTVGVGASYKLGMGRDIRHIQVSHQGVGARSFVDIKLKGSIWVSGGGEMNYRSQFRDFSELKHYNSWQQSLLLGLTKKINLQNKVKGNMQLLYDFLYRQQVPQTQGLLFRIGYNF